MFKYGISVPALSLKIMTNTAKKGFDIFKKQTDQNLENRKLLMTK